MNNCEEAMGSPSVTSPAMSVFTCWICRFQVNDPVTCSNGHLFCRSCVSRWIEPHSYISRGGRNGDSAPNRSFCPTCRIPLAHADLKPILGAQEGMSNCLEESEVSQDKLVAARSKLRMTRFNFLRDFYEEEINVLLGEINELGDQINRRNGAEFHAVGTQTEAPFTSADVLHNVTNKFETTLRLSLELQNEVDLLKKANEDLEMSKMSLIRELARSSSECGDKNGSTPQKYGRYVVSTLEKTIEELQKENEQLKKAMERQDRYITELVNKKESKYCNGIVDDAVDKQPRQGDEKVCNIKEKCHKSESTSASLAALSLPSPFKKLNLKNQTSKDSPRKNEFNSSTDSCGQSSSKTPGVVSTTSPRTTRRVLFPESKSRTIAIEPNKQGDRESKPHHDSKSQTAFTSNSDSVQNKRPDLEIGVASEERTSRSSQSPSKIPRPRSQSPQIARSNQNETVRRSPRKLKSQASNKEETEPKTDVATDCSTKECPQSSNDDTKMQKPEIEGGTVASNGTSQFLSQTKVFDQESLGNSTASLDATLDCSMHSSSDISNGQSSSLGSHNGVPEKLEEDLDQSDAFLNDIFSSTEKRVEIRKKEIKLSGGDNRNSSFTLPDNQLFEDSSVSQRESVFSNHFRGTDRNCITKETSVESQHLLQQPLRETESQVSDTNKPGVHHKMYTELYHTESRANKIESNLNYVTMLPQSAFNESSSVASSKSDTTSNKFNLLTSPLTSHHKMSSSLVSNSFLSCQSASSSGQTKKNCSGFSESSAAIMRSSEGYSSYASSKEGFLKEIDDTLAEITRLKGQTIHSLALSGNDSPISVKSQAGFSSSGECQSNTTPRPSSKRTFEEMAENYHN